MLHDRIIDALGARDAYEFYLQAGRELSAHSRSHKRYRATTETDVLQKEKRKANNRKKNKAAKKARRKNRK